MTYPLGLTKTLYNNFTDVKDEFLNIKQWAYDNDFGIIKPVCFAYLSADQTILAATTTKVALNSIDFDFNKSGGEYFDTTNNQFVCPEDEEGYYLFYGNVRWVTGLADTTVVGSWINSFRKGAQRGTFHSISHTTSTIHATPALTVVPLYAGDYVQLQCYQSSVNSENISGVILDTFLTGFRICRSS